MSEAGRETNSYEWEPWTCGTVLLRVRCTPPVHTCNTHFKGRFQDRLSVHLFFRKFSWGRGRWWTDSHLADIHLEVLVLSIIIIYYNEMWLLVISTSLSLVPLLKVRFSFHIHPKWWFGFFLLKVVTSSLPLPSRLLPSPPFLTSLSLFHSSSVWPFGCDLSHQRYFRWFTVVTVSGHQQSDWNNNETVRWSDTSESQTPTFHFFRTDYRSRLLPDPSGSRTTM